MREDVLYTLFITVENWKQRCPIGDWWGKLWEVYWGNYFTSIKNKQLYTSWSKQCENWCHCGCFICLVFIFSKFLEWCVLLSNLGGEKLVKQCTLWEERGRIVFNVSFNSPHWSGQQMNRYLLIDPEAIMLRSGEHIQLVA